MDLIYIEFLTELKTMLEDVEKSWWNEWMQRSINKYKVNKDVSYFLSAFGGCGSFNDEVITSEVTEMLKTVVYSMATDIKSQGNFDLFEILKEKQENVLKILSGPEQKELDIEYLKKGLNYINCMIENYSVGNLHQITSEYLKPKTSNNVRKK